MKKLFISIATFLIFNSWMAFGKNFEVNSPDQKIQVSVEVGSAITYAVKFNSSQLIFPSEISMSVLPDVVFGRNSQLIDSVRNSVNHSIIPVIKEKRAIIPNHFNELILKFADHFELIFRAYDDGVAYRFVSGLPGEIKVVNEEATFNFSRGTLAYYPQVIKRQDADIFHTAFEEPYANANLDTLSKDVLAFSPILLQPDGLPKVLITESDMEDYPGMFLAKGIESGLKGKFAPYPLK